jgi:hypothetical protein
LRKEEKEDEEQALKNRCHFSEPGMERAHFMVPYQGKGDLEDKKRGHYDDQRELMPDKIQFKYKYAGNTRQDGQVITDRIQDRTAFACHFIPAGEVTVYCIRQKTQRQEPFEEAQIMPESQVNDQWGGQDPPDRDTVDEVRNPGAHGLQFRHSRTDAAGSVHRLRYFLAVFILVSQGPVVGTGRLHPDIAALAKHLRGQFEMILQLRLQFIDRHAIGYFHVSFRDILYLQLPMRAGIQGGVGRQAVIAARLVKKFKFQVGEGAVEFRLDLLDDAVWGNVKFHGG